MSKNPEPAVGQVYELAPKIVAVIDTVGNNHPQYPIRLNGRYQVDRERIESATYLGTLDELRARATAGDLLYTDNSAVVERLTAENERLRAALNIVFKTKRRSEQCIWKEFDKSLDAAWAILNEKAAAEQRGAHES